MNVLEQKIRRKNVGKRKAVISLKMSPKSMMQLKPQLEQFQAEHPKMFPFFRAAMGNVDVGSIIEINMTTTAGKTLCSNMRISENDLALFETLTAMLAK